MWFMTWIINRLNDISGFFYDLYLDCYTIGWPVEPIGIWFYYLSDWFSKLAWNFGDFSTWVSDVAAKVANILNWTTVWSNIISIVPNLEAIRDWFYSWWVWVDQRVTDWWSSTSTTVIGWIDAAKDWAKLWIDWLDERINSFLVVWSDFVNITWPQFTTQLSSLLAAWSTFITITLPTLPNWLDIDKLINDTLKRWFPFYDGLSRLWDSIAEFFTDPEEWLYKSLDRIIERFW